MSENTRKTLLLRVRDADDAEAWEEFFGLYAPLLTRFFLARRISVTDAEDIVQDSLRRVATAAPNFEYDPEKGKFRSWLFRVAKNEMIRHFEKKKRHAKIDSEAHEFQEITTENEDEHRQKWDDDYRRHVFAWACERVKPNVSETAWNAFWETSVQGREPKEVGDELDMTVGAIYIAKSRVVAHLRDTIAAVSGEVELLDSPKFHG